VDTTHFTPERRSERLRERWRMSGRDLVLLYVGRVSREKGLGALPEILYRLRALGVPHRMVVAGDGPYRRTLEAQIPDAVFTGRLNRADVADVFASADVFVSPSATDTAGNAVLEAQASGVAVVVSGEGGPREQICPGVTGLVCEGNDPRRWAEAIAHLATHQERRGRMGHAAREFALSRGWCPALAPLYQAYRDARRAVSDVAGRAPRGLSASCRSSARFHTAVKPPSPCDHRRAV
jgi:glycosyltransferase involved in cell wall biosynthesis